MENLDSSELPQMVPDYSSAEEEDNQVPLRKTKRQKVDKDWQKETVFSKAAEAQEFVEREKTWSYFHTNETEEGRKRFYRCNQVKYRGEQCLAAVYLCYDSTNTDVILYRSGHDHNCNDILTKSGTAMTNGMKAEIEKLFALKQKPKAIMEKLSKLNLPMPSLNQVKNHLATLKKQKFGSSTISLGELEKWLQDHSTVPEDENKAFVVEHEVTFGKNGSFRYFVSSKTLLKMAKDVKKIHADATYKLVWQGFPVLVVGTTDESRQFHCFGMGVCTDEKTDDFKFLFNSLKSGAEKILHSPIDPSTLISDAAKSIHNSFKEVFGDDKLVVMCWAHMKKNVSKKVEKFVAPEFRAEILSDIDILQLSQSNDIFDKAAILFLDKWYEETEFISYFEAEWLDSNRFWYEDAEKLTPSTNNALESFNRVIKDENSMRERQPISRFSVELLDWIERWSGNYTTGLKVFHTEPKIDLKLWKSSYDWANQKKSISSKSEGQRISYEVPAKNVLALSEAEESWETFDEFKERAFNSWTVILPKNRTDWKKGECNCPAFFKKFLCKHVVGLAIRLKAAFPPIEAKNDPFSVKAKRGRPTKSKKALLIQ